MSITRKIHYDLLEITKTLFEEGNPAGIKAALNIMGIIKNNLRLPLTPISRTTHVKLTGLIAKLEDERK